MTDLHAVDTFVDEAAAFHRRHPDLDAQQASFGGLAWGLLRALAECPECPGTFRRPLDAAWTRLACPRCGGVWETAS